jgi:hypothetical protein
MSMLDRSASSDGDLRVLLVDGAVLGDELGWHR